MTQPEHKRRLLKPITMMIGYSDHRLVKAQLDSARPRPTRITYTCRDFKGLEMLSFTGFLGTQS